MKRKIISLLLMGGLMLSPLTVYAAQPGDMIVSYCESYVAMRAEPSTDAQVIGRLANFSAATVIGAQDGWYQVTSGGLTGWVSCDYFLEGDEAIAAADSVAYQIAVPNVEAVNVRSNMDENSNIVGVGNSANQLIVTNYDGGAWVAVNTADGGSGYVNADYVTLQNVYPEATAEPIPAPTTTAVEETTSDYTENEDENESIGYADTDTETPVEQKAPQEEYTGDTSSNGEYLGTYTLTAYCGCEACNGGNAGITAMGVEPSEGWTVACNSLPLGTQISINGNTYEVQDTGNMDDGTIDIFMNSHDEALNFGVQSADVYVISYGSGETVATQSESETAEAVDTSYDESETQVDIGDGYIYDTESDTVTDTNTGEVYSGDTDIVNYARQFVGKTPYAWGGNSYETGMDCSHFVWNVLKDTGAYDGDYVTSDGFLNLGEPVDGLENAQAGDVIVYNGHVAIYDGEGGIIEAKGAAYGTTNDRAADSSEILGIRRIN
jgi:cell wall-associated NlpC family hydrolase